MFSQESKIILVLTGLTHFAVHSSMLIFPAIMLVLRPEFGVDLDTLGWIYMLSNFMFGLGAIPAGWIEHKVGGKTLLLVYQLGVAVAALTVTLARSLTGLTASLVLLGLLSSIYHPAGLTIISRRIPQISRAMGYHGIAGSSGLALGPLLGSWFAATLSWRWAYGAVGLFSLVLAVATSVFIEGGEEETDPPGAMEARITKLKPLAAYYCFAVLMGLTFYGFTTYMPVQFSKNLTHFFSRSDLVVKGGLFTTFVLLAGIPGQLLGGKLGDRFDRTAVLPLIALGHVPLLVFFGLTSNYILVTSGILLGMVHFSFQPIGNSLIAQFTSSSSRGMGYGISFFLSFGIGSLAAGAGGTLAVRYGVSTVFPAVAMFMVVAFFVSLYLRRVS